MSLATVFFLGGAFLLARPSEAAAAATPQAPPGFIYAQGTSIMRDGSPIVLSGPNEAMAFTYTLWGGGDLGKNQLFPSGPLTGEKINGVSTPDEFWREYFRYFLHYQQVGSPTPNLVRIAVGWDFGGEESYYAWKANPTQYYDIFDRMVYWAKRAGVYLCPMIMAPPQGPTYVSRYFDRTSSQYAHLLEFGRAIMQRYDGEAQIAMWDLFNEPDVLQGPYWDAHGGFWNGYRPWVRALVADLEPSSPNHLVTVGHGVASADYFFADGPGFGLERHFAFNDVPGLDVSHEHTYFSVEDGLLLDLRAQWATALGKPYYVGEIGYNGGCQNPLCYGYWPWFVNGWAERGAGPVSPMVFLDNGRGPFADYPYRGALPTYPADGPPAPPPTLPVPTDAWRGQYFDTEILTIQRVERIDPMINFDFGTGSPDPSIVPDTFSARWEGLWTFGQGGTYRFTMTTDDGIRVWVDNGSVLNEWKQQPPTTYVVDVNLTAGVHNIEVEWNELAGGAVAVVSWTFVSPPPPPPPPSPASDTTPPATVSDLHVASVAEGSATLQWTAPGDDGMNGQATWYDFRSSALGPITEANFHAATHHEISFPRPAGSAEQATIEGLTNGATYWFAFQASDEVPNWSPASNSPSAAIAPAPPPTPDTTPPARITNLRVAGTGGAYVTLKWTAPGDDGTQGRATWYDLRYSTSGPITASNFDSATHFEIPFPKAAGSAEQVKVSGLSRGTKYWFAVKASDEVPNWSAVSNTPSATTRRCLSCAVGIPSDLLGVEGAGDLLLVAMVATGLSGGLWAAARRGRRPPRASEGSGTRARETRRRQG